MYVDAETDREIAAILLNGEKVDLGITKSADDIAGVIEFFVPIRGNRPSTYRSGARDVATGPHGDPLIVRKTGKVEIRFRDQ